jgi:hypothetical protein
MKFYNLLIKYRLQLGIALMIIGGVTNYFSGFWPAFPYILLVLFLCSDIFSLAHYGLFRNT